MKQTIRLTEGDIRNIIKEVVETDYKYMSDNDIANQYSDMEVTFFDMRSTRDGNGWSGTFELQFPNADDVDYDSSMVNNFIVYDLEGNRIAWDQWMPDEQTHKLESMIRDEIKTRLAKNNLNEAVTRAIRKFLK